MKRPMRRHHLSLPLLLLVLVGMAWPTTLLAAEKTVIFVTVAPQAFLVKRLGGAAVEVHTLIGKGQDPHTYEPTPRQAAALAGAHLFFTVDLPFERRLVEKVRAGNQALRVVDTTSGITRIAMEEEHHAAQAQTNTLPPHEESDPHVWMAPANLRRMAATVATALGEAMPAERSSIQHNLAILDRELLSLDQQLTTQLAPHRGKTFYVFHPAFGYFAGTYGLHQKAVETGGKAPSPRQLSELIRRAREDGVRVIFVQPQFDAKSATTVANGIDGRVVAIDSLAENVLENLALVAGAIAHSMR